MALDLSDEALGLAPAKQGLGITDEDLGLPPEKAQVEEPSRAQFKPSMWFPGSELLGLLEQPAAGIYGLSTQAWAGLKGVYKGSIAAAAGLPFGETFREEFNKSAESAADAYVPLTPLGEAITHKISDLIGGAIHGAGEGVFQFGWPLPAPFALPQMIGKMKGPGAGSPLSAATAEALTTLATLVAGPGAARRQPAGAKPAPTPLRAWDEFAAKYPESAKAIDASSLGSVRFEGRDTSILDAVMRQLDTELGLTGSATELPFRAKAAMVFDKVAPQVSLGEKTKAVGALEGKIKVLDDLRVKMADERGLPPPGQKPVLSEPITVTQDGVAITADQARWLDDQFRSKTPDERANALAVSLMGQMRVQAETVIAQKKAGNPLDTEMRALQKQWEQAFPDTPPIKRAEALERFLNFEGQLTYPQVLEALGPWNKRRAEFWKNAERGAIDIEGMDYLLNSFKDLPDQPVLKRATIVGQLNRQGVPEAERQAVLRALRDRDSITKGELVGNVAADILPLKPREMRLTEKEYYPEDNPVEFYLRIAPGKKADIRVWQMPIKTDIFNHFDDAQYFAHTRGFEKGGVRSIAEIQSDLMQGALRNIDAAYTPDPVHPALADFLEPREQRAASPALEMDYAISHDTRAAIPKLKPLEKRWYERILMEENRQASKDGVRVMRVATAETAAKSQGWIRGLAPGLKKMSEPAHGYDMGRVELMESGATLKQIRRTGTDRWEDVSVLPTKKLLDIVARLPKEGLSSKHQTIYNFYKQEIASFTRARFNAREVGDELGNTWMEWGVSREDATAKIPAFGGRQRGAIDIPEYKDVERGARRAEDAALHATAKGWTAPAPADDVLYKKTQAAFERSRQAELEGHQTSTAEMLKRLRKEIVAHDYDLRKELEHAGPYGQKALDRLALQNGATMSAKTLLDAVNENIFLKMDSMTKTQVDELMRLRRIIEIDSYKGVGKHKHPEGITGPQAEAVALRMQKEIGKEQFARVYGFTNQIMKEYKDILNRRHAGGLLSDESYLRLLHFDYSPTEFINLIDPMQTYNIKGHTISVRTSGVPFLERGKRGEVLMDSQLLIAEALARSENLIAKNNTLKSLFQLAKESPENAVVRLPKKELLGKTEDGEAYLKHTPKGWTGLGVRNEGGQSFVLMREDLAEQFVQRPEAMREFVATSARVLSGTALIKATATTYNPTFIIAGLPMDILHTWLATSRDYSPHLPMFAGQMARDLSVTTRDAWGRGPKYQAALREGIGAAFMTHEGRGLTGITNQSTHVVERQMMPRWEGVKKALSYVNESADIWVRMAHRERLIRQGMESWQATARARDRLDYSVGGPMTRAIDTIVPYTNVAVNALSKVVQAWAKDKADLATKLAWGGSAVTAWVMANIISSPETWQQIPTSEKIRSLPITFGDQLYVLDPDGNKRYFYMPGVRLDAVVGPLAALIVAGLESAEFGKAPDDILKRSIMNLNPVLEIQAPPVIEGFKTYLGNFDAFTGRPITRMAGQVNPEDEGIPFGRGEQPGVISRIMGQQLGMSPPRLEAAARKVINSNNFYLSTMGWTFKQLYEGADPREISETMEESMLRFPGVRSFVKLTNPSTMYMQGIEEKQLEEGSRRKQMTDSVDNLLFQVRKGQATIKDVQAYLGNQPPEDREWLSNYAVTTHKVKEVMARFGPSEGIPNEAWWRATSALEPRPRAQEFHSQWLSADDAGRHRMEGIVKGLQNAGSGYYSESFRRELLRERQTLGVERR